MNIEEAISILYKIKQDNENKVMIIHNNSSNIQIRWSSKDLKEMAEIEQRCAKENKAIETLLTAYEKEKEKNKEKETIGIWDKKYNGSVEYVKKYYVNKEKLRKIICPSPENPIPIEVQQSEMYKKLVKEVEA